MLKARKEMALQAKTNINKIIPWSLPYFDEREDQYVAQTMQSKFLSQGDVVSQFEKVVKDLTQSPYCVAVSNGTAALDIALKVFGVQPEDEVVVPGFAYIASVNSILYQGAIPVFADIDEKTFNIDLESVKELISPKTKGIIVLDYGGQGPEWEALISFCREKNLFLLEDGAPGFGGKYKERALCTLGDIGITSFHAAKMFTSVEGGMVFLKTAEQDEMARVIRSQGESITEKYIHPVLGHNYRMSNLHAAVGLAQMTRYHSVLSKRAQIANFYTAMLANHSQITVPYVCEYNQHAWFLYPLLVENRNELRKYLLDKGIQTNVSWPLPAYRQEYLRRFFRAELPVVERTCAHVLCLPMYYSIADEDQKIIVDAILEFYGGGAQS